MAILGGLILLAIIVLVIIRIIIELRVRYLVITRTCNVHMLSQYCVEFRQWKKELERARFAKVIIVA